MTISILIGVFLIVITNAVLIFLNIKKPNNETQLPYDPTLSIESRRSDLSLVHLHMDRCIIKVLHEYLMKNHTFSDNSSVKFCSSGKYRDLIRYLLRADIFFDLEEDNRVTFFETFIIKIYFMYISETSPGVKNLFYKYYSGYTIDDYNNRDVLQPSVQPFMIEYVRSYLWCRLEEIEETEHKLLADAQDSGENYLSFINKFDLDCSRKLSLNIYHMNDLYPMQQNSYNKEVNE